MPVFCAFQKSALVTPSEGHSDTPIPFQRAVLWSLFWLGIALLTTLLLWIVLPRGDERSVAFLAGYLIEESLSVDNLFVFLMLFSSVIPQRLRPLVQ